MASHSVESSLLFPDIQDIISSHKDSKFDPIVNIEAKLHTVEKDLNYEDGLIISDLNIYRNYVEDISDYIEITFTMLIGTFIHDVYPFLDNIEVTLITEEQLYKSTKPNTILERYKAVYLLDKNSHIGTNVNMSKNDLNQLPPINIVLQLLNRSAETLRIKTIQGNYDKSINKNKDMSIESFLKSIISEQSNKVLIENKPSIDYIEIEKPDNTDKLTSITLPTGTHVITIADYIQNNNIGIYNSGLGSYIQNYKGKKTFFIYSLYDGKKYKDAKNKIIFYMPITSSHSISNMTYKEIDDVLKVITVNNPNIEDNKESAIMSSGSGIRSANAKSFMNKPVEMTKDGPSFKKSGLNTEIVFKDRKDNINYAPAKRGNITGNNFKLVSKVLKDQGNYITIEWYNCNHNLIYPGASCKIVYESKDGKIKEYYGVIHTASISASNPKPSLIMNFNSKNSAMALYAKLRVFILSESL